MVQVAGAAKVKAKPKPKPRGENQEPLLECSKCGGSATDQMVDDEADLLGSECATGACPIR